MVDPGTDSMSGKLCEGLKLWFCKMLILQFEVVNVMTTLKTTVAVIFPAMDPHKLLWGKPRRTLSLCPESAGKMRPRPRPQVAEGKQSVSHVRGLVHVRK